MAASAKLTTMSLAKMPVVLAAPPPEASVLSDADTEPLPGEAVAVAV